MRIYQPTDSLYEIPLNPARRTEFETHSDLFQRLKEDDFDVRACFSVSVGAPKKRRGVIFDIGVFKEDKAICVIEVKSDLTPLFKVSSQAKRYRQFGIPLVLFWNMAKYSILKSFLETI